MTARTLLQRRKSGIYYIRKMVPASLRSIVGKSEIVKSLGTSSYNEAISLLFSYESDIMQQLNQLAVGSVNIPIFPKYKPNRANLMNNAALASVSNATDNTVCLKISESLKLWEEEKDAAKGTIADWQTGIRQFIELNGDLDVKLITKKHIKDYISALRTVGKIHKSQYKQGLDKILKLALSGKLPHDPISHDTLNKKLTILKSVLNEAVNAEYIDNNPAIGISISKKDTAEKEKRMPFTSKDLEAIFHSPVYRGCKSVTKRHEKGVHIIKDERFWIPLIGLYTGARIEEIGQSLLSDIKQENDIYYLDINSKGENKSLKTDSSVRIVPLHNDLLRLGFIEYTEQLKGKKQTRLFPNLKPKKSNGKYTQSFSHWFNRHLERLEITESTKVFHSFRHTFKDMCRNTGIEPKINDQITGHSSNKNIGDAYGRGYSLPILHREINKIRLDCIDLSSLYVVNIQDSLDLDTTKNISGNKDVAICNIKAIGTPTDANEYLRLADAFIRLGQAEFTNWKPYHIGYQKGGKWYELDLKPYFRPNNEGTEPESNRIRENHLEAILSQGKLLEDFSQASNMYDSIHIELGKLLQSGNLEAIVQDKTGQYYNQNTWKLDYTIEEILLSNIKDANGEDDLHVLVDHKSLANQTKPNTSSSNIKFIGSL